MKYSWGLVLLILLSLHANSAEISNVVCSFSPSQSDTVNKLNVLISSLASADKITLFTRGLSIVKHSSELPILTGPKGYIAGTIPGAMISVTIVKVAFYVGGSLLILELACAPVNHPDLVNQVINNAKRYSESTLISTLSNAKKFQLITLSKWEDISIYILDFKYDIQDKYYELTGEYWYEKWYRKTKRSFPF